MNFEDLCRVCANKIKDQKRQKNLFCQKRGQLLNKLKLITGVDLKTDDENGEPNGLPQCICERCQSELDLAIKFRERCIFSQKYFNDMLRKERGDAEDDELDMSDEPLIDIDDEQLFAGGVLIEPDEIYLEEDVQSMADEEEEEVDEEDNVDPQSSVIAAAEAAYVADLQEQQSNQPAKSRQKFFICDECGHLSVNVHSYSEHLRAHADRSSLKQFFPCNDCNETFTTKAKFRYHRQQAHNNLRIFKCSTCSETFAAFGDRRRHEKTHVNERPYPCLECDMVFGSIEELKLHAPSHVKTVSVSPVTNTRRHKFRCAPCGQQFSLLKHLHQHNKSKAHKSMLRKKRKNIDGL